MGILMGIMSIVLSSGNIFLFCFVGSLTTTVFRGYAEITYESIWYKFPADLQKHVLLIIADAQRPQSFDGFGFIHLSLTFFMTVVLTISDSNIIDIEQQANVNIFNRFYFRRWRLPSVITWCSKIYPNNNASRWTQYSVFIGSATFDDIRFSLHSMRKQLHVYNHRYWIFHKVIK